MPTITITKEQTSIVTEEITVPSFFKDKYINRYIGIINDTTAIVFHLTTASSIQSVPIDWYSKELASMNRIDCEEFYEQLIKCQRTVNNIINDVLNKATN